MRMYSRKHQNKHQPCSTTQKTCKLSVTMPTHTQLTGKPKIMVTLLPVVMLGFMVTSVVLFGGTSTTNGPVLSPTLII